MNLPSALAARTRRGRWVPSQCDDRTGMPRACNAAVSIHALGNRLECSLVLGHAGRATVSLRPPPGRGRLSKSRAGLVHSLCKAWSAEFGPTLAQVDVSRPMSAEVSPNSAKLWSDMTPWLLAFGRPWAIPRSTSCGNSWCTPLLTHAYAHATCMQHACASVRMRARARAPRWVVVGICCRATAKHPAILGEAVARAAPIGARRAPAALGSAGRGPSSRQAALGSAATGPSASPPSAAAAVSGPSARPGRGGGVSAWKLGVAKPARPPKKARLQTTATSVGTTAALKAQTAATALPSLHLPRGAQAHARAGKCPTRGKTLGVNASGRSQDADYRGGRRAVRSPEERCSEFRSELCAKVSVDQCRRLGHFFARKTILGVPGPLNSASSRISLPRARSAFNSQL